MLHTVDELPAAMLLVGLHIHEDAHRDQSLCAERMRRWHRFLTGSDSPAVLRLRRQVAPCEREAAAFLVRLCEQCNFRRTCETPLFRRAE